jgi:O-antigen/teichoic acid export membrane protein
MSSVARKGLAQLMSSAVMAVLQLAQIAVVARTFHGADLGIVALYSMMIALATVLCDFGLQSFVIQDKREREATLADVAAALPWFVGTGIAICLIGYVVVQFIGNGEAATNGIGNALLWITPTIPLAIFMGPLQGFAVRDLDLERLAFAEAAGKLVGVGATVLLAYFGHFTACVMIGFYAALIVKLICMQHTVRHIVSIGKHVKQGHRKGNAKATASYALAQLLSQFVNVMGGKADEMLVGATMPLAVFGVYSSMKQFVLQANAFISPMVRRTTMPLFAAWRRDAPERLPSIERAICWSTSIYVCFYLSLALSSGLVTKLLYGHAFAHYADWLGWLALLWAVRAFENGTISAFMQSTGAPFVDLGWSSVQSAAQAGVLVLMSRFGIERMLLGVIVVQAVLAVIGHYFLLGKRAGMGVVPVVSKILLPVGGFFVLALLFAALERALDIVWLQPLFSAALAGVIAVVTASVTGYPKFLPQARTRWTG